MNKIPLWKGLCFIVIPVLVAYQWAWGEYFASLSSDDWSQSRYQTQLTLKLIIELALYLLAGGFLLSCCRMEKRWVKIIVAMIFLALSAVTAYALLG